MHAKQQRTFFGEETAAPLLGWLNSNSRKPDVVGRIQRLLEAADRRGEAAIPAWTRRQVIHGWSGRVAAEPRDIPRPGKLQEFRKATEEINCILAEYKVTPKLWQSSADQWNINWAPVGGASSGSKARASQQLVVPITTEETYALLKLLELASRGLISRVKKCDCGLWFYMRFPHQQFHSTECQQSRFRSDPGWKAKRREYMKALRALHKRVLLSTAADRDSSMRRKPS